MVSDKPVGNGRGLNIELHPALRSSNLRVVKSVQKGQNPYTFSSSRPPPIRKHNGRRLEFYEKGEFTKKWSHIREEEERELKEQEQLKIQRQENKIREDRELQLKVERGEVPDESQLEQKYLTIFEPEPEFEWWDLPYLKDGRIDEKYLDKQESSEDEDDMPSLRYIKHPVPVPVPDANIKIVPKAYLTKIESRKMRRARRKAEREDLEEKMRAGLISRPGNKIKLANMMNVYENTPGIMDPTQWESDVKLQVAERRKVHEETNNKRHAEAIERRKIKRSQELQPAEACVAFKFHQLADPKMRYKINMNAKQLKLQGFCLRVNDREGLILVRGSEKSCRFFSRLVTKRLSWADVEQVWNGCIDSELPEFFMKNCENEQDLLGVLNEFGVSYMRKL